MANNSWKEAETAVNKGFLVVVPTDTIFGIVASALKPEAVEAVYEIKGRDRKKPCIVLCEKVSDLETFGAKLSKKDLEILKKIWPNPVSVVVPCGDDFRYLHRGGRSIAFRLPRSGKIRAFIKAVGPIVAPSANLEGCPPAENLEKAREYFGEKVKAYVNGRARCDSSTLVSIEDGEIKTIRAGVWKVPEELK